MLCLVPKLIYLGIRKMFAVHTTGFGGFYDIFKAFCELQIGMGQCVLRFDMVLPCDLNNREKKIAYLIELFILR